jgi:hypothetical protein
MTLEYIFEIYVVIKLIDDFEYIYVIVAFNGHPILV